MNPRKAFEQALKKRAENIVKRIKGDEGKVLKPEDMKLGTKIVNKKNPEWGEWRVMGRSTEGSWEIRGRRGEKELDQGELHFWQLAESRRASIDEKSILREHIDELKEQIKTQESWVKSSWELSEHLSSSIQAKMFEENAKEASRKLKELKSELVNLRSLLSR